MYKTLFEHIQTLEMFNIQESDEYRKLSRERILSESEEAYHRSAQLTEEQFNSLEWVDADDILNEMRRIIEKAKNVI